MDVNRLPLSSLMRRGQPSSAAAASRAWTTSVALAWRPARVPVEGRTVIVVDDGIATGATARAALKGLRRAGAGRLVLAVPVAPPETIELLCAEADEVVCPETPAFFGAISMFYADFHQVGDDEVVETLARAAAAAGRIRSQGAA